MKYFLVYLLLLGAFAGMVATILYIFCLLLSLPMVAVAAAGYTGFIFPALGSPQAVQWGLPGDHQG